MFPRPAMVVTISISAWVLRCSFYSEWQCESLETAERAMDRFPRYFFVMPETGNQPALNHLSIMHKIALGIIAVAGLALASCSTVSSGSGMGVLYTGVTEGQIATSNSLGTKVGTSSSLGVLGLVSVGDASIQTAANSAGIKKISHVDVQKTSILGLYASYKTVVYGE